MEVKANSYAISNSYFKVGIGASGEISTLQLTDDMFPTNYVMNSVNSPDQNTEDHEWLGEIMFTYSIQGGAWKRALTNQSSDVRTINKNGSTITVTYKNSANEKGIKDFEVIETYSLVKDYIYWQIEVVNNNNKSIEIGDFGLPLPFNEIWPSGEIYETQVLFHSYTGNNSSYITAKRPSGLGNFLLMTPDSTTGAGFEYMDHWVDAEHSGSMWAQGNGNWANGLNVFYINSNVIKSTNRGYLPNTSTILKAGQSRTYAFKFFNVQSEDDVKNRLYNEGLIDVTVVPGMMVATNMSVKVDLHTFKTINSISTSTGAAMTYLETVATNHKIYSLKLTQLGTNNVTINYGNGEKTVLQFYAIEPIEAAIERHATFMVNSTQVNDSAKFYNKVFDDWMMDSQARRDSFNGYMSGWGDDWGLTHGEFLAEKNVQAPVISEVTAVDEYLETCIWNELMINNHEDYKVHDWFLQPFYTDDQERAFAYPHVWNTYLSMYKISNLYPKIITYKNDKKVYLLRAYNIYMVGAKLSPTTGLMGESTTGELIECLQNEGYTSEAQNVINQVSTKYNNFKDTKYPYGSEYNYDNTGEEAVYTYAKINNNTNMLSKINLKTRACRGQQPVWYYYANPVTICGEAWWNFQYSVSLVGYCMDDWVKNYSTDNIIDERLNYAAKIANIGCINSGQIDASPKNIGTVAWTYQSEKGNYYQGSAETGTLHNAWRQMSGEADLGLFGAIRILSSDIVTDPIFGLFGYGCQVTLNGSNYEIVPKDGVFKKLNLINEKFYMTLSRDQYTSAIVSNTTDFLNIKLNNQYTLEEHITELTLVGLKEGSYSLIVNNIAAGNITAVDNVATVVEINVGTEETYEVVLQKL